MNDLIERLRAELQTFRTVFSEDHDRPMMTPRLLVSEVRQIIAALERQQPQKESHVVNHLS